MFFKNAGSKIKSVSEILFWIECVVYTVLMVVALVLYASAMQSYLLLLAIVFILALVLGWLLIWVECLLLYGFGELIENTAREKEKASAPVEEVR